MAAAVMQPMASLSLDREIMPPSPVSQNFSRHGRSRHGGSAVKGKARGRGYSVVDDREVMISKALTWVLKRTIQGDEEQAEGEEKLVADAEGWVNCEEVLERPNLSALQVTFAELQALVASPASKSRFSLKPTEASSTPASPSGYLIRANPSTKEPTSPSPAAAPTLTALTPETPDLPSLIVYETSYANYPLILASGGIKRAGGQPQLTFSTLAVADDGTETRAAASSDADVSIYISLRAAMERDPKITWFRTESGAVVTEGDARGVVGQAFWKKVVARRADIGVLFEDGQVRKEIPIGLRGKGAKPKKGGKGRGKGINKKAHSEDEESTSD